jgi:hypothetical protein
MPHNPKLDLIQDTYTPDCGVVPEGEVVLCGVCQAEMKATRNCVGARGFAAVMARVKTVYDRFECPHRTKDWHKQVVAIRKEAMATSSKKLEALLLDEARDILLSEQATKTF